MKIVVCIKQVPDTNEVRIDPKTGTLIRDGVPSIINPDDKNALEEAIKLKEQRGNVSVSALCMGPPQADTALREALAMGVDEAILLSDRAFSGSDTYATSEALAAAIKKLGEVSLILCGRQAIDGDTAQVGPQLAQKLGIPQITCAASLELDGDIVRCRQEREGGCEIVQAQLPCMVGVTGAINTPRYPSMAGIFAAYAKPVAVWTIRNIDVPADRVGLAASPTNVLRTFTPETKREGKMLEGSAATVAAQLVGELERRSVIKRRAAR
ncbi:MAG: electron transfer flavoprotein subunit beta/FixA family protein [Bacillota bacterium]